MKSKRTWNTPTLVIHGKVEEVTAECYPVTGLGDKQNGRGDAPYTTLSVCR
ncbi:lasso peptide [Rhodothermus marinus]|uniref:lasso peptide n=1 Tax=Rhodothermus marinus TaxID=29549 RepID=UPI0034E28FC6